VGVQWASRSCAHKYLGKWKENGTLERVLTALQEISIEWKLIFLTDGSEKTSLNHERKFWKNTGGKWNGGYRGFNGNIDG